MNIQIDGTNTLNKGAELMLAAICDQIIKTHPKSTVFFNSNYYKDSKFDFKDLNIRMRPGLKYSRIPIAILARMGLPYTYFTSKFPVKGMDIVLDGAGFQFSDQWKYSEGRLMELENYYRKLKMYGTKIIMLPQACGPFETSSGKRMIEILNSFADVIIARERISFEFLINSGADKERVWLYPDFTSLVNCTLPNEYESVKGKVCIIPNRKMVTHTGSNSEKYLDFLENLILEIDKRGKEVFLLNHEGEGDLKICNLINSRFDGKYEIVSGLNAKNVKGVIGASFLVVSSRFHGVASALNQGVPCLSTSWNHKYEMLFEDYNQSNKVIDLNDDLDKLEGKLDQIFNQNENIRVELKNVKGKLVEKTEEMWGKIWETI
ncbi:polysaccharide pyruvyl transferase family protein [Cyclobacterium roseum]|uniref:polysaccharide pyruvyl transferase family protein n=1 Tax=Cyclobacterium roseum TaxID=2666137 RepID=UPI0013907556|nr:polysaccharide pyruvyl transferase family protein [Cyclobacterium roseum]